MIASVWSFVTWCCELIQLCFPFCRRCVAFSTVVVTSCALLGYMHTYFRWVQDKTSAHRTAAVIRVDVLKSTTLRPSNSFFSSMGDCSETDRAQCGNIAENMTSNADVFHLSEIAEASVVLEPTSPQKKRSTLLHLVDEILRTERDFQENVYFTVCKPLFFLQEFVVKKGGQTALGGDDIQLIKSNLQHICHCSTSFLEKLESANSLAASGSPLLFGHVFNSFIPRFLDIYSRYCANFEEHGVVILQKLAEANIINLLPAHHTQELEGSKEWCMSGRSLQSLLIKPVQRLPRYELLLRELRKLTPPDHADSKQLDLSLEQMKNCIEQVNTAIGAAKLRGRSRILNALLMSRPSYAACKMPPLMPPKRCCVDHWFGSVRVTAQAYLNASSAPEIIYCLTRKLLVLSDRLVFIGKEKRQDWRVTAVFPLRSVWLNAEEGYPCLFVMTCDEGGCDHEGRVPDGIYMLSVECLGKIDDDFEVPLLENSPPSSLWPQLQSALSEWISAGDKTIDFNEAYVEDLEVRKASANFVQQTRMFKEFLFDTGVRAVPIVFSHQRRRKTLLWLDDRPDREDNLRIRMRIPGAPWFDELEMIEHRDIILKPEDAGKAVRISGFSAPHLISVNGLYISTSDVHCHKPVFRKSDGNEDELMWIEYDDVRQQWQVKDSAHRGNAGWSLASISALGDLSECQMNGTFWKAALNPSLLKPNQISFKLNDAATDSKINPSPLNLEDQVDVTLFLSVAAMVDFLSEMVRFARYPPSHFRIISNRRLYLGTVPVFCCSKSEFLCDGVSGLLLPGDPVTFDGSHMFGGMVAGTTYYLSSVRRSKNKEFFSVSKDKFGAVLPLQPCALQADAGQGPRMTLRASHHSLLHFLENSEIWRPSFPATCIFHGGGGVDELRSQLGRRPNLFSTSTEAECYAFVAFEHMATIQAHGLGPC